MAVRLKDIARDLGVSTVTVSKVLRNRKDVGEKTRQRVLKRMEELQYKPNLIARALISGRTSNIGLVVPDLLHPYFAELAKSLGAVLRENDQALILASSEDDPELEQREIRTLLTRGVDLLLISSCQRKLQNFYKLGETQTPFLLVDRNFSYLDAHFVGSDDYKIGQIATQHLLDMGCKRIAHIAASHLSTGQERMRGYTETLQRNNVTVPAEYIITREHFEETGDVAGYKAMQQLLSLENRPDAVFCYNDLTAMGGIHATIEAGLRVPQDVAFVGCGNFRYAEFLRVPLTSVDQSTAEIGRLAGETTLKLIEQPDLAPTRILVEPQLKIRASSQLR